VSVAAKPHCRTPPVATGAGEGIRTLDPNLGKKTDWLFLSAPDLY